MNLIGNAIALVLTILAASAAPLIPAQTVEAATPKPFQADKILVEKGERKLTLFRDGEVLKEYRISLGFQPVGKKTKRGDGKTPEGTYNIDTRNPASRF